MEFEVWLEGITAEIINDLRKTGLKVRMFFKEFVCLPEELFRSDDGIQLLVFLFNSFEQLLCMLEPGNPARFNIL